MLGDVSRIVVWRPAVSRFAIICKVCCLHDDIYAFFEFCNVTLELASCLCCLEVLPTAQPNQLASLARCLGSVGAPKTELVQFYDALEDFQDQIFVSFSAWECLCLHPALARFCTSFRCRRGCATRHVSANFLLLENSQGWSMAWHGSAAPYGLNMVKSLWHVGSLRLDIRHQINRNHCMRFHNSQVAPDTTCPG